MKLLLFTDSLSLPRQDPEQNEHQNTWPELLRKAGHEVCLSAIGGGTIDEIQKQLFYFHGGDYFDAVFVQCGIVDCAPRFVKKWELKTLRIIPFGKYFLKFLNHKKIRSLRNLTYTTIHKFDLSLRAFEASFSKPVFFIEILPANSAYESELPGIIRNIDKFNEQIIKRKHHISMRNIPREGIMTDHHHLNEKGHRYLANEILKSLSK